MKAINRLHLFASVSFLFSAFVPHSSAFAQGTAFTYQGRLAESGAPANGNYDLTFALFNTNAGPAQIGSTITNTALVLSNGLFIVALDFGPGSFPGDGRWLEIGVRTNGAGGFNTLIPREKLTASPYAITAGNLSGTVPSSGLFGVYPNLVNFINTSNIFFGAFFGDGSGLTNVNAALLNGLTDSSANTANTIVKRDGAGSFSAGSLTLSDNLNLPPTTATAGIIYSGGSWILHAYGNQNFFAGPGAGNLTMTGGQSTASGWGALGGNTSGDYNTASGYQALAFNDSGSDNTASGAHALFFNANGNDNTASGLDALGFNTSGNENTASGVRALTANTSGSYNTAVGFQALFSSTIGHDNIALGYLAGSRPTNGNYNIHIGNAGAGDDSNLILIGTPGIQTNALIAGIYGASVPGGSLVFVGPDGKLGTGGSLSGDVTGTQTATIVSSVGGQSAGNVASGASAANAATSANTATTIVKRDASGNFSAGSITLGGRVNLPVTTATAGIIYSGANTLLHAFGANDMFVGLSAGNLTSTGSGNTGCGTSALGNETTGSDNSALGHFSLGSNNSGNNNTAAGYEALLGNTTGNNNIGLGYQAGLNLSTGNSNICIAHPGVAGNNNTIRIGTGQTNTFIAGIFGATSSGGTTVFVNSSGQLGTATSSARYKQDIQDMKEASDVLLALRPVTFRYKPDLDPNGIPQFGLVAEEVDKVDPDLVVRDGEHGIYSVRYEAVNAMLLNEFLKQHRKVQELENKLSELQTALKALQEKE